MSASAIPFDFERLSDVPSESRSVSGGFRLLDAAAIFAPLPPPDYLANGLIRRGSVIVLGGYAGTGKTWLAVSLLVCVAAGTNWLGSFDCEAGPVAYLDWENGEYELRGRIQRVVEGMGIPNPLELPISMCPMPDVHMRSPEFKDRIMALAENHKLIVVDSLRAASPGADENDSSMREGLDLLRRVADRTGCVFLVIAHSKKSSGVVVEPREILRGSSAILDAADSVLIVRQRHKEPAQVSHVKNRHGRPIDDFIFELVETGCGTEMRIEVKPVPTAAAREQDEAEEKEARVRAQIVEVVRRLTKATNSVLRGLVKGRATSIDAMAVVLASEGILGNVGTEKRPEWVLGPQAPPP